jgi:hypothetical protein
MRWFVVFGPMDVAGFELLEHLERTPLTGPEAARVVAEVLEYFSESLEQFITRRHGELQSEDENPDIFARIATEVGQRRFAAPGLSERQISESSQVRGTRRDR